jgi:purine-binding chemotaxis protein CheW
MSNPPNFSEQELEAYFNDLLLSEPALNQGGDAATVVKVASGDSFGGRPVLVKPAGLASAAARRSSDTVSGQPARAALPMRAYAEPIKTLNLRMPLPTLAPVVRAEHQVVSTSVAISPEQPPMIETPPAVLDAAPAVALAAPETDRVLDAAPVAWLDNGRPAWAQQPFECLLFKVGGLALAAPLAELGSIYPLDAEQLTAIFGQAAWFMGLLPVKGYNVRTIDAAQIVMPERYAASMRAHYRYVITLHASDWGLAVDSVADSLLLQPDDVRWRGQRGKRPWLAGTVVTQMCALLDVAQLVWLFQNQDGKRI